MASALAGGRAAQSRALWRPAGAAERWQPAPSAGSARRERGKTRGRAGRSASAVLWGAAGPGCDSVGRDEVHPRRPGSAERLLIKASFNWAAKISRARSSPAVPELPERAQCTQRSNETSVQHREMRVGATGTGPPLALMGSGHGDTAGMCQDRHSEAADGGQSP